MPIVTEDSQTKRRRAPWWVLGLAVGTSLGLAVCSFVALVPVQAQVGNVSFYSGADDLDEYIQGPVEVFTSRDHFSAHLKVFGGAYRVSVIRVNIVHGMVVTPVKGAQ